MRVLSPRTLPPVTELLGSTAVTATFRPRSVSRVPRASMSVLLPAPGTPVMPTRTARPGRAATACTTSWARSRCADALLSMSVMARASRVRSPRQDPVDVLLGGEQAPVAPGGTSPGERGGWPPDRSTPGRVLTAGRWRGRHPRECRQFARSVGAVGFSGAAALRPRPATPSVAWASRDDQTIDHIRVSQAGRAGLGRKSRSVMATSCTVHGNAEAAGPLPSATGDQSPRARGCQSVQSSPSRCLAASTRRTAAVTVRTQRGGRRRRVRPAGAAATRPWRGR